MGQPVAFFKVISPDHERAQKFYSELFGWQVAADPAMGGYGLVDTGAGDGAIGGGRGPRKSCPPATGPPGPRSRRPRPPMTATARCLPSWPAAGPSSCGGSATTCPSRDRLIPVAHYGFIMLR